MRAAGITVTGLTVPAVVVGLWLGGAAAQMVLPGAVSPTPEGTTQAPSAAHTKPRGPGKGDHVAKGTGVAIPGVVTLFGKTLTLDGNSSQVTFGVADQTLAVSKLTLTGEKISGSQESCRVEAASLPLSGLGKPNGLQRLRVEFPACPIVFDVLDGAVLADASPATCEFTAADCRVRPAGLWGPVPGDLGPDRVKSLERARGFAEAAVRSNYKALTASTKDRPTIMGFARDQAQFSSSRAEICRDYADEGRHGYCATKLTEARAALLHDKLGVALEDKEARKAKRKTRT